MIFKASARARAERTTDDRVMTDTRHPRSSRASASVGRVAALAARRQSISPRRGTRRAMLTMSVAATTTTTTTTTTIAKASPARGLAARSTAATTTTTGLGLGRRRRSSDAARRRRRGVARRVGVVVLAASSKGDDRPVVIIDNYDSFTYNLSQVRARASSRRARARESRSPSVRPPLSDRSNERTNERGSPPRRPSPSHLLLLAAVPRRPRVRARRVQERREDRRGDRGDEPQGRDGVPGAGTARGQRHLARGVRKIRCDDELRLFPIHTTRFARRASFLTMARWAGCARRRTF